MHSDANDLPGRQDDLPGSEEERANNPDGPLATYMDDNNLTGRQDELLGSQMGKSK
jgi:hypothetical protein